MPAAARLTSTTVHGGVIVSPPPGAIKVETVLIGGLPAAVVGSVHECPLHLEIPLNVVLPSPSAALSGEVLIGGLPAARVGDLTTCGAEIILGALNVTIGGGI